MSSDGGSLLSREVQQKFNVIGRLAACCTDYREPSGVEHSVPAMLAQRTFAPCMGYEDLNDHNRLRDDFGVGTGGGAAGRNRSRAGANPQQGSSAGGRQHTEPLRAGSGEVGRDGSLQAHSGRL